MTHNEILCRLYFYWSAYLYEANLPVQTIFTDADKAAKGTAPLMEKLLKDISEMDSIKLKDLEQEILQMKFKTTDQPTVNEKERLAFASQQKEIIFKALRDRMKDEDC